MQLAYDRSLRRYDKEGRLHVELTPISKANICPYFGCEIPNGDKLGLDPSRIYQMFRAPEELAKAAQSSNNIQLMETHVGVSARDPKKQQIVGSTGTDGIFEAPYLKNSLVIWDKPAIDLVESDRKKELSCSYSYTPDMTPGTYMGMRYDGVMRELAFNHVALVEDGRAGSDVLVEDSLPLLLKRSLIPMPKNAAVVTSRKALVARGALQAFIAPKLANDAQIDYSKIVRGITAANWVDSRPIILSRVKIATNGKLANDEDLDGMDKVLGMLDKTGEDEKDDEDEDDDEEKKARDKAAADKKAADEKAEKEREAEDKRARDKRARDKKARDAMTEEEREAEDKRARDEEEKREKDAKDKAAADKRARDEEREKEKAEDKKAMDAAIATAKKDWQREQRELLEARDIVTPVIGVVLAQDSAAAYYELLFDKHNVDLTGITPAGYKTLAQQVIARVTARPTTRPVVKHANDSAVVDFNKRFPDVARVRTV